MNDNERLLKDNIITVGTRLYDTGIAVARSGNISCRLDAQHILITGTGTRLGNLRAEDIVTVCLEDGSFQSDKKPSSELSLHTLIYRHFPVQTVIHAHPPLVNGYFAVAGSLKALVFETTLSLGNVPVIPQETPSVTKPEPVLEALRTNNVVVLKNHGVVAVADTFDDGLSLIEALEEAVKTAAVARLFQKDILDDLDAALKDVMRKDDAVYEMFSPEHIRAIVDLVNNDAFIAEKGKELDLTVQLAISLDGSDNVYKFNFEQGKIVRLDRDADAPFVISAPAAVWEQVFLGTLDSFVAVTQGKMKLQGQLGQLSKWYVPFSRLFQLFKQAPITRH